MTGPLALLRDWLAEARAVTAIRHPSAACLSTIAPDGTPTARFVDVKEVNAEGLVFGTSLDSPKAVALVHNAAVSLTFWWDHVEKQVRVSGRALRISDERADILFSKRPRDAQLASWGSQQSTPIPTSEELMQRIATARVRFQGRDVQRPPNWGGYEVAPNRMEFLRFSPDRLHERIVFERTGASWVRALLQP